MENFLFNSLHTNGEGHPVQSYVTSKYCASHNYLHIANNNTIINAAIGIKTPSQIIYFIKIIYFVSYHHLPTVNKITI